MQKRGGEVQGNIDSGKEKQKQLTATATDCSEAQSRKGNEQLCKAADRALEKKFRESKGMGPNEPMGQNNSKDFADYKKQHAPGTKIATGPQDSHSDVRTDSSGNVSGSDRGTIGNQPGDKKDDMFEQLQALSRQQKQNARDHRA